MRLNPSFFNHGNIFNHSSRFVNTRRYSRKAQTYFVPFGIQNLMQRFSGFHEIIHNVISSHTSPLKTMGGAMYICLILVKNQKRCTSTAPEQGGEPEKNDFESSALAIKLLDRLSTVCQTSPLGVLAFI